MSSDSQSNPFLTHARQMLDQNYVTNQAVDSLIDQITVLTRNLTAQNQLLIKAIDALVAQELNQLVPLSNSQATSSVRKQTSVDTAANRSREHKVPPPKCLTKAHGSAILEPL